MLKATERMHNRSKMIQVGCTCMGQQLTACYRTLADEETGLSFCMILRWNGDSKVEYLVQKSDELMHWWFEDNGWDLNREEYLEKHAKVVLPKEVLDSPVYKRVMKQLRTALLKRMAVEGLTLDSELNVIKA